jgi:hypothetical protein
VFGGGCNESTVMILNPRLVNASLASEGRLGVAMMTSGYLDPARLKLSFSTRAAGRYELLERRVTYAFLDSIFSDGEYILRLESDQSRRTGVVLRVDGM